MADTTPHERVTPELVAKVAKLARLALDEAHVARYATQLESILAYVDKIKSADVTDVEPMTHAAPLHNILREDTAGEPLARERALQNAPETDGSFFKVPKVIGGDDDSAG